jgi:hypothetical protein
MKTLITGPGIVSQIAKSLNVDGLEARRDTSTQMISCSMKVMMLKIASRRKEKTNLKALMNPLFKGKRMLYTVMIFQMTTSKVTLTLMTAIPGTAPKAVLQAARKTTDLMTTALSNRQTT